MRGFDLFLEIELLECAGCGIKGTLGDVIKPVGFCFRFPGRLQTFVGHDQSGGIDPGDLHPIGGASFQVEGEYPGVLAQ